MPVIRKAAGEGSPEPQCGMCVLASVTVQFWAERQAFFVTFTRLM
jgi:hypothetical protein